MNRFTWLDEILREHVLREPYLISKSYSKVKVKVMWFLCVVCVHDTAATHGLRTVLSLEQGLTIVYYINNDEKLLQFIKTM